jgi:hypothetical protein
MRNDIPLQTPMGDYWPSLWQRCRLRVYVLGSSLVVFLLLSLVPSPLNPPQPLRIRATITISSGLDALPRGLDLRVSQQDVRSGGYFTIFNTSDSPLRPYFVLMERGHHDRQTDLTFYNGAVPDAIPYAAGHIETSGALLSVNFSLQAIVGLTSDNSIPAHEKASFVLFATNARNQKGSERNLSILISDTAASP